MPQLARITATFFTNLINRLGIRPPFDQGFEMSNVVQPVSLVDSDISIPTVATPPIYGTPFTAGPQAAPPINTILADTGPLPAGNWSFTVWMSMMDTAAGTPTLALQHRDAANAANIWEFESYTVNVVDLMYRELTFSKSMQNNERLRALNKTAAAGGRQNVVIFATQLS